MPRITTYKNSKLASAFSIIGYIIVVCGVYAIVNDEAVGGTVALVIGFLFKVLAAYISKRKREKDAKFDQWLKS